MESVLKQDPHVAVLTVLFIAPMLGLFSALSIAPFLALLAIAMLVKGGWRNLRPPFHPSYAVLGLAFAWALASCLWSPSGTLFSLRGWSQTLGTFFCGAIVVSAFHQANDTVKSRIWHRLSISLTAAAIVLLAVGVGAKIAPDGLLAGRKMSDWTIHFDRQQTICVMMLWPAAFALQRMGNGKKAVGLLVLIAASTLANVSLAAKIALLSGLMMWCIERLRPGLGFSLVKIGTVGFLLFFPLAAAQIPSPDAVVQIEHLPSSAAHRLIIWKYVADKVAQNPITGWGYESSRTIGNHEKFSAYNAAGELVMHEEILPLHPHNATMQLWVELGGIGVVLVAAFLWLALSRAQTLFTPMAAPYAVAIFTGCAVILNVSYGVWQSWWLSTVWLTLALVPSFATEKSDDY